MATAIDHGPVTHDLAGVDRPDRTNDPLLNAAQAVRDAIALTAYQMWRGNGYGTAPCAQWFNARYRTPRPGDLVYIPDALYRDAEDRRMGFGYLLVARDEPTYTAQDWARVAHLYPGQALPTERAFYIQHGPHLDDVVRWDNADCRAIPYTQAFADEYWHAPHPKPAPDR